MRETAEMQKENARRFQELFEAQKETDRKFQETERIVNKICGQSYLFEYPDRRHPLTSRITFPMRSELLSSRSLKTININGLFSQKLIPRHLTSVFCSPICLILTIQLDYCD